MPVVVHKYGGSSLADTEHLKAVANKIVARKRAGDDLVVVVSAMGDTTDQLLALAGKVTANPKRRELDMLLTVGERTTMALLSMAIHDLGEEATSLTGSQCGILTTDSHSRARIMEVRPFRVQDELAKGHIVIVAGYQGTSYKREITTLGRGGSDMTAVALAAALGAVACEIYSDVDGVYSADPRVVPSAQSIDALNYDEMIELARGGAKVLHRDAVEWARGTGVALYARSTFSDGAGTVIRKDTPPRRTPVTAVAGRRDLVVVHSDNTDALETLQDIPITSQSSRGAGTRWILTQEDTPEMASLCQRLESLNCAVTRDMGSVTVVGAGLGEDPQAKKTINHHFKGCDSELTAQGWTALMPAERVDNMVRALHNELLDVATK